MFPQPLHALAAAAPTLLSAFISHCPDTDFSNRLTPIVQSRLLNQERKKEKKLLIERSLPRLKVC